MFIMSVPADIRTKMLRGGLWALVEKFGLQAVSFCVTLVLARLLTPDDYGTVALLAIFTSIAGTLVDAGFGDALIQKKNVTDLDFNTVFYFSLCASGFAYLGLFFAAPTIARFYSTPELVWILRIIALNLIFHAINSVQIAELNRNLLFNKSFKISLVSNGVSATVGIFMALKGFGPWALVAQTVSSGAVSVVAYWVCIRWRPRLMFSWTSLKGLLGFAWKLAFSTLLDSIYSNLSGLLIGKFYTKADLAFVDKGRVLPSSSMTAINGALERVSFPVLSQLQEDREEVKRMMRKIIVFSTFLVFPLMSGCAVCAPRLIEILFGETWLPAVPFMQLVCFQFALRPFHSVNLRAILAMGRSDIFLRLEIFKKVVGVILLALSLPHGVVCFVAVSCFVTSPVGVLINSWPNRKLLGYTIAEQIRDVLPSACLCLVMVAICWALGHCSINALFGCTLPKIVDMILILICQFVVGVSVYIGLAWVFRMKAIEEYLRLIKHAF